MTNTGTLVFKGKRFLCTRCGGKWINLEQAEGHTCAEQKQEAANDSGKKSHRKNQGDAMRYMRDILTKRVP
jgi:hypothetical protein